MPFILLAVGGFMAGLMALSAITAEAPQKIAENIYTANVTFMNTHAPSLPPHPEGCSIQVIFQSFRQKPESRGGSDR